MRLDSWERPLLPGVRGPAVHFSHGGAGPQERGSCTSSGSPMRNNGRRTGLGASEERCWGCGGWAPLPGMCCPHGGWRLPRYWGAGRLAVASSLSGQSLRPAELRTHLQTQLRCA